MKSIISLGFALVLLSAIAIPHPIQAAERQENAPSGTSAEEHIKLGQYFLKDVGRARGREMAEKHFRAAAELGNAEGYYKLGEMYAGRGGRDMLDMPKALRMMIQAAERDHTEAQLTLGFWYETGRKGVPKDMKKAVFWFRKIAELHPAFSGFLCTLYRTGEREYISDEEGVFRCEMQELYERNPEKIHEQGNRANTLP